MNHDEKLKLNMMFEKKKKKKENWENAIGHIQYRPIVIPQTNDPVITRIYICNLVFQK